MKTGRRTDRLCSLREEIVSLAAVKCRMTHERVISTSGSMLPAIGDAPELGYKRIGLCPPEVRAQRLACSHTMARINLGSAIKEINALSENNAVVSTWDSELNYLNNEIHLLDHLKGEAEKGLAMTTAGTPQARDHAQEIRQMELLHDKYVDEIATLRDRVVLAIDKLIE